MIKWIEKHRALQWYVAFVVTAELVVLIFKVGA